MKLSGFFFLRHENEGNVRNENMQMLIDALVS